MVYAPESLVMPKELSHESKAAAKRLADIFDDKGWDQGEVASKLGYERTIVNKYINAKQKTSDQFLRKLQDAFGVSRTFILTGEGEVFVRRKLKESEKAVPINFIDETDVTTSASGMEYRDLDNGMVLMTIPLVDEYAYASYPHGWKDPEYVVELPKYSIVLPKRERGIFRAFEVRGDSMDDGSRFSIGYGDVAIGRKIEPDYWDIKLHTNGGTDYVVVTHDGIVVKRITGHNTKEGIITCSSINPDKVEYPDYEVRLTEVYELYKVRKVDRDWSRR